MSRSIYDIHGQRFDNQFLVFVELITLKHNKDTLNKKIDDCLINSNKELFLEYSDELNRVNKKIEKLEKELNV